MYPSIGIPSMSHHNCQCTQTKSVVRTLETTCPGTVKHNLYFCPTARGCQPLFVCTSPKHVLHVNVTHRPLGLSCYKYGSVKTSGRGGLVEVLHKQDHQQSLTLAAQWTTAYHSCKTINARAMGTAVQNHFLPTFLPILHKSLIWSSVTILWC